MGFVFNISISGGKGKRMSLQQLEITVCNDHLDLKISGDYNNDSDHAHGLLSCVIV